MTLCDNCNRSRSKHDQHLIDQGLIECKPCEDSSLIVRAFWTFAEQKSCSIPFRIEASGLHKEAAWPLQFHPDAIKNCSGYLAK